MRAEGTSRQERFPEATVTQRAQALFFRSFSGRWISSAAERKALEHSAARQSTYACKPWVIERSGLSSRIMLCICLNPISHRERAVWPGSRDSCACECAASRRAGLQARSPHSPTLPLSLSRCLLSRSPAQHAASVHFASFHHPTPAAHCFVLLSVPLRLWRLLFTRVTPLSHHLAALKNRTLDPLRSVLLLLLLHAACTCTCVESESHMGAVLSLHQNTAIAVVFMSQVYVSTVCSMCA